MIRKVVVTYDFTDETYIKFIKKEPGMRHIHIENAARIKYDQQLFGALQELGINVKMLKHKEYADIDKTMNKIKRDLVSADLIFHTASRIAFEMDSSEWKEQYQNSFEKLVHDNFLEKTHFLSKNITYTDKQNAAKIAKSVGIPTPKSWTVDDYFSSERVLPVVLKEKDSARGEQIYFIDKHKQLDKFFNMDLYDKSCMWLPNKEDYEIQEFIETPSNHYTHYRIFTLGDGRILGAVMGVSKNKKGEVARIAEPGPFGGGSDIYHCVDSPLYLECLDICSNKSAGGTQIPLAINENSKPISRYEKKILIAHGINTKNIQLPETVRKMGSKVARIFSKYGILYAGQDWLQDKNDKFYFLEINLGPGMEIFNTLYKHGKGDALSGNKIGTRKVAEALKDYQK